MKWWWLALAAVLFCAACGTDGGGDDDDNDASDDDSGEDDDDDTGAPSDESGVGPARTGAFVTLPDYPFWPNDGMVVSNESLNDSATAFCALAAAPNVDDYLFGHLPMQTFDWLLAAARPPYDETELMGSLYVSGYFGGIWLKEAMGDFGGEVSEDLLRLPFLAMAGYAAQQLDNAAAGEDWMPITTAHGHLGILTAIYGYNLGYLQQIIENPPPGVASPTDRLECAEDLALDCRGPGLDWAFLTRFNAALDELRDPSNSRWVEMAEMTERMDIFIAQGRLVWEMFDLSDMDETTYLRLVDLSVGFLLISKVAVLGHMTAWATRDAEVARLSLPADGGLVVWSGSYFIGLMAGADGAEGPTLDCPANR